MKIIIPRIAKKTTDQDLLQFVQEGMASCFSLPFLQQPQILSSEVIVIQDVQGQAEYHGLIEVEPDAAARKVLKKLNGLKLQGKVVGLREYKERKVLGYAYDPMEERRRLDLDVGKVRNPSVDAGRGVVRDYSSS